MKRDDLEILKDKEIEEKLDSNKGWKREEDKITKKIEFNSFMDALSFIVKLAPFCEANDHHPDIKIEYNKVKFELQRFDVGGKITNLDFLAAGQINKLLEETNGERKIKNYSALFKELE